jgi:hypothetical protein
MAPPVEAKMTRRTPWRRAVSSRLSEPSTLISRRGSARSTERRTLTCAAWWLTISGLLGRGRWRPRSPLRDVRAMEACAPRHVGRRPRAEVVDDGHLVARRQVAVHDIRSV